MDEFATAAYHSRQALYQHHQDVLAHAAIMAMFRAARCRDAHSGVVTPAHGGVALLGESPDTEGGCCE